ncbi:hypothetical protein [Streptomyces sp. NBC_00582]|uniref:hypothetical protein n=1 Tax=Streptomyces sp. NBC_00582 TaxID=2975783 RepID=UPI001062AE63|nr:hypothetical protein [Streptomyces sp. NBC_00582]WUB61601.1 hypothetical protein OG852_14965 [Streptomyces sp. NBC_00582]
MPFPLPPRTRSGPRRRTLLASAAGAALLVGCSSGSERSEEVASAGPSVTERARARAAEDSGGLLQRYDAVLAVHPTLARRLAPLRAEVVRHVEAFGGAGKPKSTPSASASATVSPSGSAAPSLAPSASPATEKEALAGLAAAERRLADERAVALLDVPGELARLLASVAAAGAAHAYLLTEGNR